MEMDNRTLIVRMWGPGQEERIDKNWVPTYEKPADVCFWCHGELEPEVVESKATGFGKYYCKCKQCQNRLDFSQFVFVAEVGPIQGLINQPMYEGEYPDGANMVVERKFMDEYLNVITGGEIGLDKTTEEVLLYPDPYSWLEDKIFNAEGEEDE